MKISLQTDNGQQSAVRGMRLDRLAGTLIWRGHTCERTRLRKETL
jgi:hypothetical protein